MRPLPTERAAPSRLGSGTMPSVFWRGNDTSPRPRALGPIQALWWPLMSFQRKTKKLFCFSDCVSEIVFFKKKILILTQCGRSKPQTSNPGLLEGPCPGPVLAPDAGGRRGSAEVAQFSPPQSSPAETLLCCWPAGGARERVGGGEARERGQSGGVC